MQLAFTKLNGLGNDFVVAADPNAAIELSADQVARICDRRFGVGADGIILVRPSGREGCAGYMHYINSDGTLAQMCGNGVRCCAKYLIDTGMASPESGKLVIDTLAGPKPISFELDDEGRLAMATVDMGAPILAANQVPTSLEARGRTAQGESFVSDEAIASPWGDFRFTCVSMGNPHAVCFIDDWNALPASAFRGDGEKNLESFALDVIGEFFESCPAFPEKANIEFAEVGSEHIAMRVFERGCRETLACGTGACATSVAATLTGRAGRVNDIKLPGGVLRVLWNEEGHVMMTGPAAENFTGTVTI